MAPLARFPRWINWRLVQDAHRPGKPRKIPINPRTGQPCGANDPSAWCSYDEAEAAARRSGDRMGFCFVQGDGLFFLDLDNCRDPVTGELSIIAQKLVNVWDGQAAIEVSQSGRGLHIFGWASVIPEHACKNTDLGLELYHKDRFVAFTDDRSMGTLGGVDVSNTLAKIIAALFIPASTQHVQADWGLEDKGVAPDDALLLETMLCSRSAASTFGNKAPFAALWVADADALAKAFPSQNGYDPYDRSSADAALACHLAYWCGSDLPRIERFMRESALLREKWDERPDYLHRTISHAISVVGARARPLHGHLAAPANHGLIGEALPVLSSSVDAEVSEDAIAEAFKAEYAGGMKFDHQRGKWFVYDPLSHWVRDDRRGAFHRARLACRAMGRGKRLLGKASTAEGVEKLLRADPVFAVTSDVWDRSPMLLGVPGGAVDLRTGELLPASPEHMITKTTSVVPAPGLPLLWLRVLAELFPGDTELVCFLKRFFGYVLTGSTREHALLFFLGPGGNGKSTVLNVLTKMLASYAATATMETFMATSQDRHTTDLAMLQGPRLVTASETESGKFWAEARLKALTGGDPITARFMRQDNFTFPPQFKLIIAGNHPPRLRNADDAMRRRLFIVPFLVKPNAPDPKLEEKLQAELPQILAWCIEGALEWQREGLNPPQSVRLASEEYFETQDIFGQWLTEKCELAVTARGKPDPLFQSWAAYAQKVGFAPGDTRAFADSLKARGFGKQRSNGQKYYTGLALKVEGLVN
ncbi:hypothetical protein GTZ99_14440 [Novosphingobium sp. FSY-8]|uniref:SF3 helicase domain-containing protein n=1 Tax=Novosphingobium ovatum TaxID=1908523 RepID=A0ABW9XGY3_9SPHN|nr:phage/plasmid primase, P4 family [Novosphingobium ovatum]NBC37751.1 hypothetical protein [Novosphingobium ovatum]